MDSDNAQAKTLALKQMEGKIDELPLLPQVLVKLMQLDRAGDDYFDEFERLVREDPTFAVRVIALANSASSAPASPITSIREAITRMGAATISGLVASLAVQRVFMPSKPGELRLWTHSILAACATEQVAKIAKELSVDPGHAYLAGLLHDIGRFVMMEHTTDGLQAVDESDWRTPDELIAADFEVYRFTHSELGYLACNRWGLPKSVSRVVRDHHANLSANVEPGSVEAATYCVQVADRLCMFVLEQGEEETPEVVIERIRDQCVIEIADEFRPDSAEIFSAVPNIRDASNSLIQGLGL